MVFQTAPPQPASKARLTCSPQLVGGAEASQNGFGDLIPAVLAARLGVPFKVSSGMSGLVAQKSLRDADRGPLAVGNGIHDLAAAIDAVASGKVFLIAGLAGCAL